MIRPAVNVRCNSRALTTKLLDRGLTVAEAATAAGMSPVTLASLIRRDKRVTLRTASKLRATFGGEVIQIPAQDFISARRREVDDLTEMRAQLAKEFPDDSKRLQTIDALITGAQDAITNAKITEGEAHEF